MGISSPLLWVTVPLWYRERFVVTTLAIAEVAKRQSIAVVQKPSIILRAKMSKN